MGRQIGFPTREQVERVRNAYPAGTRIELISMNDDPDPVPNGSRGTVQAVDDAGQLLMKWDCHRSLSLIPGVDDFRKLTTAELLKEQTRAVAATGRTNMFATKAVFDIAMELGYDLLCDFVFMDTRAYSHLILTGELPDGYEIPEG